jgi:hypothetical protein
VTMAALAAPQASKVALKAHSVRVLLVKMKFLQRNNSGTRHRNANQHSERTHHATARALFLYAGQRRSVQPGLPLRPLSDRFADYSQ